MIRALVTLALGLSACTPAPASPPVLPDNTPVTPNEAPVHFVPGPLVVEPKLPAEVSGWAGIGMYENLIASGFSADSKLFANCHVAEGQGLQKTCELLDSGHHVARSVTSSVDYGDGHPSKDDPEIQKQLAALGVPAAEALFRYAEDLVIVWETPDESELDFALKEKATGVETPVARFQRDDGMNLAPERVVVSPNGHRLAFVSYVIGGPPLTTAAEIVDADAAAKKAYEHAAAAASGGTKDRLLARARAISGSS